jgi:wyosine [tRNA(Phe)-imidazoG37] synthetase (radical SAM superfamily)
MGYSLGIDLVPRKTCSMNCVYCEVGQTDNRTMERGEWVPIDEVFEEVEQKLAEGHRIDVITITGSGEPLLHNRLGELIDRIHSISDRPVCILTNGTHLNDPSVRAEVVRADIVAPSLDAVSPEVFQRINNPHPGLKVEHIIDGLKTLRREFAGQIWLETLFVSDFNDHDEEIDELVKVLADIEPDRIHLNTVVRPPAFAGIEGISPKRLEEIRDRLGPVAEICAAPEVGEGATEGVDLYAVVEETTARRPVTRQDLADALGRPRDEIDAVVERLLRRQRIAERAHDGEVYLTAVS